MEEAIMFSEEIQLQRLSEIGNPLEKIKGIDFEIFRPTLDEALDRPSREKGGRKPFDCVMMLKILFLQNLYNLSDEQAEYQITDRLSFLSFLGLSFGSRVPDARTIWLFREKLKEAGVLERLFGIYNKKLAEMGLITRSGTIVDATFVEVPVQRNRRDENKAIKEGKIPEEWKKDTPEARHKLAHKDTDARWAKKGNKCYYGYKDHVKADADSKLILDAEITPASVHDSQKILDLIDEQDRVVYADSAYSGKSIADRLPPSVENRIHEKGAKGHPLTGEQKESNREKSRVRCRIEHIFGFMAGAMHGLTIRSIGLSRANAFIWIRNLVYNICRTSTLMRQRADAGLVCPF